MTLRRLTPDDAPACQALRLAGLLALAPEVPGLRQVNLCVNAGNAAAVTLYASLGFRCYGVEHGSLGVNGQWHDELMMACRLPVP